ncbi:MAG TPA: A/G-specific adenine glycosylase [Clostridia bacterium]|nr:A/G-specific adenine glycosylase [Clostridia bacterium]
MKLSTQAVVRFQQRIWNYYHEYGRPFPWRDTKDPYQILVSELMLQQTQTERVLKKYQPFLERFPGYAELATAPLAEVLSLWQGLGYNRRALGLKRIAELVHYNHADILPDDPDILLSFPMIGPATAGSLQAFIFNKPVAFIETNIRRVILYCFFDSKEGVHDSEVLDVATQVLNASDPRQWYYALMDYGVYLKYAVINPNRRSAHYRRQAPFENSNRQIRGALLRVINKKGPLSTDVICGEMSSFEEERVLKCLSDLTKEGFLAAENETYRIGS